MQDGARCGLPNSSTLDRILNNDDYNVFGGSLDNISENISSKTSKVGGINSKNMLFTAANYT